MSHWSTEVRVERWWFEPFRKNDLYLNCNIFPDIWNHLLGLSHDVSCNMYKPGIAFFNISTVSTACVLTLTSAFCFGNRSIVFELVHEPSIARVYKPLPNMNVQGQSDILLTQNLWTILKVRYITTHPKKKEPKNNYIINWFSCSPLCFRGKLLVFDCFWA